MIFGNFSPHSANVVHLGLTFALLKVSTCCYPLLAGTHCELNEIL